MSIESSARGRSETKPFVSLPDRNRIAPLPASLSLLIGREREAAVAASLICDPDIRLVTMTGPGGVGKTRLALRVAANVEADFADGVAFVDLTPVHEPQLVASAIAQALDVRQIEGRPALMALNDALRARELLLVLDNFEQVLAAGPVVSALLEACPRLTVLVTSRAVLHLSGERVIPVPPLALSGSNAGTPGSEVGRDASPTTAAPDPIDSDAVRLFVARSQAVRPTFALTAENTGMVAEICARLDGLPLAIELAAARSVLFSPEALLARLERRLPLLTRGPRDLPGRQRTMRDAIAWSYELLNPVEQAVLRRLAVFVGGCTFEAAESVCAGSEDTGLDVVMTIESLVRQSLVQATSVPEAGGASRLTLLETVREFAAEQLAAGSVEELETRRRHAEHYLALATDAEPNFWGDTSGDGMAIVSIERGNLRAALVWTTDHEESDMALQLVSAVFDPYLMLDTHHVVRTDTRDQLALARLALALPGGSSAHRVAALTKAAWLAEADGASSDLHIFIEDAQQLAEEDGNALAIATLAFVRGRSAWRSRDLPAARRWLTTALAGFHAEQAHGRAAWTQCILASLDSHVAFESDDDQQILRRAAARCDRALAYFCSVGHPPGIERARHGRAHIALLQHDFPHALALFHELLVQAWTQRRMVRHYLEGIAQIAGRMGQSERAARFFGAAIEERSRFGIEMRSVRDTEIERDMAIVREPLGASAFFAAFETGRALPLEQVVSDALAFATVDHATSTITLTPRERDILPLLAEDKTARQIGDVLYLSHRTVEHHIASLCAKLGVRGRGEVVNAARAAGLLPSPSEED